MHNCKVFSICVYLCSSVVPSASTPCPPCLRGGICVVVLFLAILIRGGVLLLTPGALTTIRTATGDLAENLVAHGTFGVGDEPTAYRPPLYPMLLTGCVALGDSSRVAIGVLHVMLGVATVGLVLVLGRWWGLGNRGAALAALLGRLRSDSVESIDASDDRNVGRRFLAAAGLADAHLGESASDSLLR